MEKLEQAIGGYFSLELNQTEKSPFKNLIHLNSARNCIEYILIAKKYQKVYLPYYTCDVVLEPIIKLNIEFEFFDVNDSLEAIFDFSQVKNNEVAIVNNYFGIKNTYIKKISLKCQNLIIDNAQALFSKNILGIDTVYSPRKFVGVADGGILYTDRYLDDNFDMDLSYQRMSHLLKRIDLTAEDGYLDFSINDKSLVNNPIKQMSQLTYSILNSIDFNKIRDIRINNFNYLNKHLKKMNMLDLDLSDEGVPMIYPFRTKHVESLKEKLIQNKIYCATYWPNVLNWCSADINSYMLAKEIIAIPIDQRYDKNDMNKILEIILHE